MIDRPCCCDVGAQGIRVTSRADFALRWVRAAAQNLLRPSKVVPADCRGRWERQRDPRQHPGEFAATIREFDADHDRDGIRCRDESLSQQTAELGCVKWSLMFSSRRGEPRYRPTPIDQVMVGERTVAMIGPLVDADPGRIRAALVDAAQCQPESRVALVPDSSHVWRYGPVALDDAVSVLPDADTSNLGALLARIRNRPGPRPPLQVLVCGDYVVVDYSHALGDGRIGLHLLATAAQGPDRQRSLALAAGLNPNSAARGTWRHFGTQPGRLRNVIGLRRFHRAQMADDRKLRGAGVTATKQCVMGHMTPETTAKLRCWAAENAPGATTAAINLAASAAAFRAQGVVLADSIMVLMDCRRYLDPDAADGNGNFAVGVPLTMPATALPAQIAATMREVTDSGWPIVILGAAELKARLAGWRSKVPPPNVEVSDRVRLAFSDLGRPPMFADVTWVDNGRPPQVTAFVEPDGADAVTMLVIETEGFRTFTASFYDDILSVETVSAAVEHLCDDPISLLQGAG
jgi:hypothetical protein